MKKVIVIVATPERQKNLEQNLHKRIMKNDLVFSF